MPDSEFTVVLMETPPRAVEKRSRVIAADARRAAAAFEAELDQAVRAGRGVGEGKLQVRDAAGKLCLELPYVP